MSRQKNDKAFQSISLQKLDQFNINEQWYIQHYFEQHLENQMLFLQEIIGMQLSYSEITRMFSKQLSIQEILYVQANIIPIIGKNIPALFQRQILDENSLNLITMVFIDQQVQKIQDVFNTKYLDETLIQDEFAGKTFHDKIRVITEHLLTNNIDYNMLQLVNKQPRSQQQNLDVDSIINKSIQQTIEHVSRKFKKSINRQDLLFLIVKHWFTRKYINVYDVVVLISIYRTQFGQIHMTRTCSGQNILSNILQSTQQLEQYCIMANIPAIKRLIWSLSTLLQQDNVSPSKSIMQQIITTLLMDRFNFLHLKTLFKVKTDNTMHTQKIINFMKNYKLRIQFQNTKITAQQRHINKNFILAQYLQSKPANQIKYELISQIYHKYINKTYPGWFKFDIWLIFQHCILSTASELKIQFKIEHVSDIDAIVEKIGSDTVNSSSQLFIASQINKIFHSSFIDFEFDKQFKLKNVSDELLKLFFENTEKRIQQVWASKPIFIVYNHDKDIILKKAGYQNTDDITTQLDSESLYSIINSNYKLNALPNINIHHLGYTNNIFSNKSVISIPQPIYLRSLHLEASSIQNLSECSSIISLYSSYNKYKPADINQLKCLERIISINDEYDDEQQCMIQKLFQQNQLQYVYVFNGTNIVKNLVLKSNIIKLQMFCNCYGKETPIIRIDISEQYPVQLQMLKNQHINDNDNIFEGTIQIEGPQEMVTKLQYQLIE